MNIVPSLNLDLLEEIETETGHNVHTILQLRVHPELIKLQQTLQSDTTFHNVELTYITSRGPWYQVSWKGQEDKSGGVVTNIGIHFFDLLMWLFGSVTDIKLHHADTNRMAGYMELERARVRWYLSTDRNDLPDSVKANGKTTYRSIKVDSTEIEFSEGFTDLHTRVYEETLKGNGFGIKDARPSITLTHAIRTSPISPKDELVHPFLKR